MKLTGFILLVSLLAACQPKPQGPSSYFCRPELEEFFAGPDSLPVIEFKHTDSFELVRKTLEDAGIFKTPQVTFKVILNIDSIHSIPLKIVINLETCCFCPRYGISVRLNSIGKYLAENEIGDTSVVRKIVSEELLQYWNKDKSKIFVNYLWDYSIDYSMFQSGLKAIINGYTDALDRHSIEKYNISFCKLDTSIVDSILNSTTFNLELLYWETIPKPVILEKTVLY